MDDTKNYHVWAYRRWLFQRSAGSVDGLLARELAYVDRQLDHDVLNNSAWNYRFGLVGGGTDADLAAAEVAYAQARLRAEPDNEAAWAYVRGVLAAAGRPLADVAALAAELAPLEAGPDAVRSVHALEIVAELAEAGAPARARAAYELLATTLDPLRAAYWRHRAGQVEVPIVSH
ncbi:protein prenylyltransferase [Dipodascopsis tothii]|uniref:protein prenylyltransferase n=1 Tax=Dipodascopsis tothii TaxID=44089 RepID=UPI0034CF39D2